MPLQHDFVVVGTFQSDSVLSSWLSHSDRNRPPSLSKYHLFICPITESLERFWRIHHCVGVEATKVLRNPFSILKEQQVMKCKRCQRHTWVVIGRGGSRSEVTDCWSENWEGTHVAMFLKAFLLFQTWNVFFHCFRLTLVSTVMKKHLLRPFTLMGTQRTKSSTCNATIRQIKIKLVLKTVVCFFL